MSRQRITSIRGSDLIIYKAVEVALDQLGVHSTTRSTYRPISIKGNKSSKSVMISIPNSQARVFLRGFSSKDEGHDYFLSVERIEFNRLDGVDLPEPKTVQISNFGGSGHSLIWAVDVVPSLEIMVYQVVAVAFSYEDAASVISYLWKYPKVDFEGSKFHYTYELANTVCGVDKIELWRDPHFGYGHALINGNRHFRCKAFDNGWKECKG